MADHYTKVSNRWPGTGEFVNRVISLLLKQSLGQT